MPHGADIGAKYWCYWSRGSVDCSFCPPTLNQTSQANTGVDGAMAQMPNNCNTLTSTESLATHYNFSRMPEPNNYVRDQSVSRTLVIHAGQPHSVNATNPNNTDQLRTLNATTANPASSYNSDRTHLTPMSFNAVAKRFVLSQFWLLWFVKLILPERLLLLKWIVGLQLYNALNDSSLRITSNVEGPLPLFSLTQWHRHR